ncbi:TetR family transcriptional regulator [Winogradskyella epiphytica]|uniref:TetR family transcriptional regulator n=1 Tax=Winogradskyella epiphytica TaxID=262005 RepID=A0A2V4Y0Y4_9FLAO|nr:TetR/AcrR family transcriptional regulator [Winogradskyella epiphytica]PYE82068.1 TetR family transcriptional regulator [Winogradskyella epiphytica]GGW60718.1 hypothetical protein GCM10008085_10260 [Winogradskyella epiphytica]
MARKKEYIEAEVIDRALYLFWRHGYENTSMQMLEKEMGINKFSIYSRFGNKHGLFLECLKSYKLKTKDLFEKFKASSNGVEDIKQFFKDSVAICFKDGNEKGCLLTNTYNEFAHREDAQVRNLLDDFMQQLKDICIEKLRMHTVKDDETILKEANYLVLAKHGLAAATRVNSREEIEDYIELTFKNIS